MPLLRLYKVLRRGNTVASSVYWFRDTQATQVGQRIRELRQRLGWSVHQLAQEANVGDGMIDRLEAGEANPTLPEVLVRLASTLGRAHGLLRLRDAKWKKLTADEAVEFFLGVCPPQPPVRGSA